MTGCKHGVASQLQSVKPRAVLTHCYAHALNLAVGDALKQLKVCQDALDLAFEITKLIWYSPKRNAVFNRIKAQQPAAEEEGHSISIRAFCLTRWTVRGDAIESILDNYSTHEQLWDECLDMRLEADMKNRVIGVKSQMMQAVLWFASMQISPKDN